MGFLKSIYLAPFPGFYRDAAVRFLVRMVFRYANGTSSEYEKLYLNTRRKTHG